MMKEFVFGFFKQCVYALSLFTFVIIISEYIVPGSVSPFLDPLPLAVVSLVLLASLSVKQDRKVSRIKRGFFGALIIFCFLSLVFFGYPIQARTDTAALILIVSLSILVLLMIVSLPMESEE